jgi:hypothetical protein
MAEMTNMLKEIKLFKGITDNIQDDLLELIISETNQRIIAFINRGCKIKIKAVPDEISFIVRDVSIVRFNKINSEGATSDSEEGRSFTWQDSYLDGYKGFLEDYWDDETDTVHYGGDGIARFY